jgi:hypothetical protein
MRPHEWSHEVHGYIVPRSQSGACEDRVLIRNALVSNTVELIPALGPPPPRGGPVQDPVLTPELIRSLSRITP